MGFYRRITISVSQCRRISAARRFGFRHDISGDVGSEFLRGSQKGSSSRRGIGEAVGLNDRITGCVGNF